MKTDFVATGNKELLSHTAHIHNQAADILESISDAFFALDKSWHFIYVNKQAEVLLNRKREDILYKSIWDEFKEARDTVFHQKYYEARDTGKTIQFEAFYAPLDAWYDVRAYPAKDGLSVYFTNINERRMLQEQLKNKEERFRTLIEKSTDAIQLVTPEGRLLYSSNSVKTVLGYTPEEIQGEVVTPYIHPDDLPGFGKKFAVLLEKPGNQIRAEYRVRHKDGHYVWVDTTIVNHLDNPIINALVGNFRDITERKAAEKAVKESEKKYRNIARAARRQSYLTRLITDNATLGLLMMNDKQQCTFMNPAAEAITGFTLEEIQKENKSLHEIIHYMKPDGSPYPMIECPIDRALPTQNQSQGEDIFVHPDGSLYPVAFTASPIIDDGTPTGTVIEIRDTSKEKRDLNRKTELEQLTKTLAEQRSRLISINQAKDEFVSLASHQLRTPATGVKQYLGMVLDGYFGKVEGEQKAMLLTANDSNERQLKIIDDLLNVARADAGKINPHFEQCNLTDMLHDVIKEHHSTFAGRDQTVTFINQKPVIANVDPRLIRMVLENIIDNASKYTPPGKTITIKLAKRKAVIVIDVSDQGVGIAEENMSQLFHKFSRIHNSLSNEVGGTGLGLYWSKRVVDLHSGSITVKSEPGKGTTFSISFPINPPKPHPENETQV